MTVVVIIIVLLTIVLWLVWMKMFCPKTRPGHFSLDDDNVAVPYSVQHYTSHFVSNFDQREADVEL